MKYDNIVEGVFRERPNRFIAYVEIGGRRETVHVKNTGRCKELLQDGAEVYLQDCGREGRKTRYDLIAVRKDGQIINMDSQAPNAAAAEWIGKSGLFGQVEKIRPEYTCGDSRFDFYVEAAGRKILIEVKGVTLKSGRLAAFPDAPSARALRHVKELTELVKEGYEACILFVLQMKQIDALFPNVRTQPEFAQVLREAQEAGVRILAYDCIVEPDSMYLDRPVPVRLYPESAVLMKIPGPLLSWYDRERRILPWREHPSPYRVWVSEIMLQQTRVEAVKPYFERFMEALPEIMDLAQAREETILKLWEGLGYYNRVRNMQKAAVQIQEECGGEMPGSYEKLLALPGIGSYTAGAIASIAFGQKVPAVDGNVLRVVMRLLADPADIADAGTKKAVEKWLLESMPSERPGDFNQALMELGAIICLPGGAPKCPQCPLKACCRACEQGNMTDYPVKAAKKGRSIEEKTVLMLRDAEKVALRKRPAKGLLAGLYEFPWLEGFLSREEVLKVLKKKGLKVLRIQELAPHKHIFTHKEWHMKGYYIRVDELERQELSEKLLFADAKKMQEEIPIPSAFAPFAERMYEESRKE